MRGLPSKNQTLQIQKLFGPNERLLEGPQVTPSVVWPMTYIWHKLYLQIATPWGPQLLRSDHDPREADGSGEETSAQRLEDGERMWNT